MITLTTTTTTNIESLRETIARALAAPTGRRLRKRRVDIARTLGDVIQRAADQPGSPAWAAVHGGTVANAYGWPAVTEALWVAALHEGGVTRIGWAAGRIPANKATAAGVAAVAGYRDLADDRYSAASREEALALLAAELSEATAAVEAAAAS